MDDYYKILGVPPNATTEAIKTAFRARIKKVYPRNLHDKEREAEANAKTRVLIDAFKVLRDPNKRAAYDEARVAHAHHTGENAKASQPPPPPRPEARWEDFEAAPHPKSAPQRRPSRAMWAASAIGLIIAIALVRAAWLNDERTEPSVSIEALPANADVSQAMAMTDARRETKPAKPLQYSATTYAIDGEYDRGFVAMTSEECWQAAHITPETPYTSLVGSYENYFATHGSAATQLAAGTHFKPYLKVAGDLNSPALVGSSRNPDGFLAQVLDGPQKQNCGLIQYVQLWYRQFLRRFPNYPRAKREAARIMAHMAYSGSYEGFRERLEANLASRARALGLDPKDYQDDVNTIVEITTLCGHVGKEELKAATDENGYVQVSELPANYLRCRQNDTVLTPTKLRPIQIYSAFSRDPKTSAPVFEIQAWFRPAQDDRSTSIFDQMLDVVLIRWGFIDAQIPLFSIASHT